jgi:integrase
VGSVRARTETGTLFLDFRLNGRRVREQTGQADTPANRKKLDKLLARIESEIQAGTYDRERIFGTFASEHRVAGTALVRKDSSSEAAAPPQAPTFSTFADQWFSESKVHWRRSYQITQRGAIDKYLVPAFGARTVNEISKADVLAFRARLTQMEGRAAANLSARRINAIIKPLRQILCEAAERYGFPSAFRGVKPLKIKRSEVEPFSIGEVKAILEAVREDYRPYLTVRFFTGMRTGEVHGLKWKNVDFPRGVILVREAFVLGETDGLKTDGSQRDLQMNALVRDALQQQRARTGTAEYVFPNRAGKPIDNKNFVNRIWYPLLDRLNIARRTPYQTRHTAATLWLASGEAPEWIAHQLGHTTTEMLFRVYSRYVPNLTRRDGTAFDALLITSFGQFATSPASSTA